MARNCKCWSFSLGSWVTRITIYEFIFIVLQLKYVSFKIERIFGLVSSFSFVNASYTSVGACEYHFLLLLSPKEIFFFCSLQRRYTLKTTGFIDAMWQIVEFRFGWKIRHLLRFFLITGITKAQEKGQHRKWIKEGQNSRWQPGWLSYHPIC